MGHPYLRRYKTIPTVYVAIGAILILFSLISTVAFYSLYAKAEKRHQTLLATVSDMKTSLDQMNAALAQGDLKKVFTDLAQIRKNLSALSPSTAAAKPKPQTPAASAKPAQQVQPAPVQTATLSGQKAVPVQPPAKAVAKPAPATAPVGLTIAADETPAPLVLAGSGDYQLVCEKDANALHLFRTVNGRTSLVKSYPCIVGANGYDKKKAGDLATPVGGYFLLRYISGRSLAEKYGHGAFVLNYPNFLDRKERRDGAGIWLHGHTPGKSLGEQELQNTHGCIVVANDVLNELTGYLKPGSTPIVVVNKIQIAKAASQAPLAKELSAFMNSWAKAWESGNANKFMAHYAPDFINSDGMNYQAFKKQKEKVNRGKKFIRVKVSKPVIIMPQDKIEQVAIVRFDQIYRSNNFQNDARKLFYLRKGKTGWQVFGESRL